MWPDRFYLTGTDTDVGKTVTAAAVCVARGLDYWKPVQSGLADGTDTQTVAALAPTVRLHPEAHRLPRPASPHAAAADVGVRIDPDALALPEAPRLLVEGAGGWMVPYAQDPLTWQSAVVEALGLPVVVVARSTLGTLNHTFLTLRALADDGVDVAGVVLVGPPHAENARDLARWGAPILAHLPHVPLPDGFPRLVDAVRSGTP